MYFHNSLKGYCTNCEYLALPLRSRFIATFFTFFFNVHMIIFDCWLFLYYFQVASGGNSSYFNPDRIDVQWIMRTKSFAEPKMYIRYKPKTKVKNNLRLKDKNYIIQLSRFASTYWIIPQLLQHTSTSLWNMCGEKNFNVTAQISIVGSIDLGLDRSHRASPRVWLRRAADSQKSW
jgi:hypothetical protein